MNCTGIELRNFRPGGLYRPNYLASLPPRDSQRRKACVADGFEAQLDSPIMSSPSPTFTQVSTASLGCIRHFIPCMSEEPK